MTWALLYLSFLVETDIDECASDNGGCEQNCHNNNGSYTCSCNTGYASSGFHGCVGMPWLHVVRCLSIGADLIPIVTCGITFSLSFVVEIDIDECASDNGGCEQNCHNNNGSYTCSCNTGYTGSGFHGCVG